MLKQRGFLSQVIMRSKRKVVIEFEYPLSEKHIADVQKIWDVDRGFYIYATYKDYDLFVNTERKYIEINNMDEGSHQPLSEQDSSAIKTFCEALPSGMKIHANIPKGLIM